MSTDRVRIRLLALSLLACPTTVVAAEEDDAGLIQRFTRYYIDGPERQERVFGATFLGMPIIQNPADMWMMQELITELKPDFIIETGTYTGGSALYLSTILTSVNPSGEVITIDLVPQWEAALEALPYASPLRKSVERAFRERIRAIKSNSVDPKLLESLAVMTKGKKVLVTLDSCHSSGHVLKEMELYSKLVSPGSYLVVQDTFIDQKPEWVKEYAVCGDFDVDGGPGLAVERFLQSNSNFVADPSKEKYLLTFYPSGYLRRVK